LRVTIETFKLKRLLLGALLCAAGCAARHAGPGSASLLLAGVTTAHHGPCPRASWSILAARAAQLFSKPIPYLPYLCMAHTEAALLRAGCGRNKSGNSTVFITLTRSRSVRFLQDGIVSEARIRTFGEAWDDKLHRATMFFAVRAFPHVPPPPGARRFVYRGPPLYGEFGIEGDPLGIASGECPAAT
jgi:hypothetical protein